MSDLRKALRSLPKDLDDTYARILQDIDDKGYDNQVAKILQWLAYSVRPMSLEEIAEVLTVDMESDPLVDFERRLQDPQDILELCSSLVSIDQGYIQFAHFSVREFLESSRLDNGPAKKFAVDEMRANILIAESCITYNIQLNSLLVELDIESLLVELDRPIIYEQHPLCKYAANNWGIHAQKARENGRIISLCERLFRSDNSELPFWEKVRRSSSRNLSFLRMIDAQGSFLPLHCAIRFSLPRIMRKLILEGANVNSKNKWFSQTPLILVTKSDIHLRVKDVPFLLSHGAEVNTRDGNGCTALMYASEKGFVETVQILLENGADLEAQDNFGKTALLTASFGGYTEIVHLLLGRGASIDSPIGEKALGFASYLGHSKIAQILLDRGVDVDASCDLEYRFQGIYSVTCTALPRALARQKYETMDLLVKSGADINARYSIEDRNAVLLEHVFANTKNICADFRDAEHVFTKIIPLVETRKHRDEMFRFLIEHGADPKLVNTENFDYEAKKRYDEILDEGDSGRLGRMA